MRSKKQSTGTLKEATCAVGRENWPADDLEPVSACPVCGATERTALYAGLVDVVFGVAPGEWSLQRCTDCRSAYLDPRPTEASIGRAYGTYYTHLFDPDSQASFEGLGVVRKARRMITNGYLNARFGTTRQPQSVPGGSLVKLFPRHQRLLDAEFRFLPRPRPGQRLLDVGCGNGAFLARAALAGWTVSGVDFDPKAVHAAQKAGLQVTLGSLTSLATAPETFDAITMSHVIEHVHEPLKLLLEARRLLKPGGVLFVETPNLDSLGLAIYGRHWRGIEAPRHLALFNADSLSGALSACGFRVETSHRRDNVTEGLFLQSKNLQAGRGALDGSVKLAWRDRLNVLLGSTWHAKSEFLSLTARRLG